MSRHTNIVLALLLGAYFLLYCGDKGPTQNAGDVTETGNAFIRGKMVNAQGAAMDSAEVSLIGSTHNPLWDQPMPGRYTDTTDAQGYYEFVKVDSGHYHIQGVSLVNGEKILIKDVRVAEKETLQVATDTLQEPGIIDLVIEYSLRMRLFDGYVYLPGTSISNPVDKDPHIIIGPVAAGTTAIYYTQERLIDTVLVDTVLVRPGQVTQVYVRDKGPNWPRKN